MKNDISERNGKLAHTIWNSFSLQDGYPSKALEVSLSQQWLYTNKLNQSLFFFRIALWIDL